MLAPAEMLYLNVNIDGVGLFRAESGDRPVAPGELLMTRGGHDLTARTTQPFASNAWYLRPRLLAAPAFERLHQEPLPISRGSLQLLTSVVNTIVNDRRGRARRGDLHPLLEHLLISALVDREKFQPLARGGRSGHLLDDAQALIESRFRDPAFDVEQMVRTLRTSRSALSRAYRVLGTTPSRELALRRLREADLLRGGGLGAGKVSASELATMSGFRSARHLRDTIARHEDGTG
ncbi:hypothetical protein ACIPY5_07275 [Microbacterium sp. NPDC089698]|uniref:hypothetical protein n=1 Tax=Microbacterium sp. NPDC089698 TaxID=3364200 RepID=UPI003825289B